MVQAVGGIKNLMACQLGLIMTAFHEGGHTICGLLSGFQIESVWVTYHQTTKIIEGFTAYDDSPRPEPKWLHAELCVSYAGMIAEDILFRSLFGATLPKAMKSDSSDDMSSAQRLIRQYLGKSKQNQLKKKIICQTDRLLTKHWGDVILVSYALIQNRHLNFSDLRKLLVSKSKRKKFWKEQFKKI
jgi:hypothetical protein